MKVIIIILGIASIWGGESLAQDLYSLPESVVYDSLYNRYLVSNWGTGHIVELDSLGNQSYWVWNQQCYAGLTISDEVLYVACREYGVKGFDLHTGERVLNVPIPGATNINDIITDNDGNIFVSYPTGSIIYRVDIEEQTYNIFVNSGITTPNGMYFDEENNRIVLVSYRMNSPVQAVSLADSSVTTLPAVTIHNLDGISRDNEGDWYVSSWFYNAVYRFENDFMNAPELFATFGDDPADISVNLSDNILAVPLFFTSQVEFVQIEPSGVENNPALSPDNPVLLSAFPNPFNCQTTIPFSLNGAGEVSIDIFDITGRSVGIQYIEPLQAGYHEYTWNAGDCASGVYLMRLTVDGLTGRNVSLTQQVILMK